MLDHDPLYKEFNLFLKALGLYFTTRLKSSGGYFERCKNFIVDVLMVKRGANTSLFVHLSILILALGVLLGGGVLAPKSIVSGSFPGVPANPLVAGASTEAGNTGVISSSITPVTVISDKPRSEVLEHEVKSGETISSIAQDFGISESTVLWENDLTAKSTLGAGQKIRILPVSGIAHKVTGGDSIYSVAKQYQANAQAIIDFPFNDIPNDFQLKAGQTIIVPDGAPQAAPKPAPTQYLAQQNIPVSDLGSAQFIWPAAGGIAQYFSWYHPALDISNLGGGPIRASDSGTVTIAGWPDNSGYGNRVMMDHGNGYTTLYAHMSAVYVSPGQKVSKGEVVGAMGSTGRSTGVHLHFEIRKNGIALNPPSLLGK